MIHGEVVEKIVEHYLAPMRDEEIDCLILGCTHYPLLADAIRDFLGSNVILVECSKAMAKEISEMPRKRSPSRGETGIVEYYTTDAHERFRRLAHLFLGSLPEAVIQLEELG